MILWAGLGWALLAGADPRRVALLGFTLAAPWSVVPLVAWAYLRPASPGSDPVVFCEAMSAELRSGATLAQALRAAGEASGLEGLVEAYDSGATAAEMGRILATEFEDVGGEISAAVVGLSRSGAPSAELFDEIGALALAQAEIAREVRVASAPARATVALFVAAPLLYLVQRLSTAGLADLVGTPAQRGTAVTGLVMLVAGLGSVLILVGRVR